MMDLEEWMMGLEEWTMVLEEWMMDPEEWTTGLDEMTTDLEETDHLEDSLVEVKLQAVPEIDPTREKKLEETGQSENDLALLLAEAVGEVIENHPTILLLLDLKLVLVKAIPAKSDDLDDLSVRNKLKHYPLIRLKNRLLQFKKWQKNLELKKPMTVGL